MFLCLRPIFNASFYNVRLIFAIHSFNICLNSTLTSIAHGFLSVSLIFKWNKCHSVQFSACKNPRQIHPVAAQNNILKKTASQWNVKKKGLMRHAAWVLWPDCFFQVSFTKSMHTQSFTVEVCVIDKNDNVPVFLEESMRGSVQLRLLKGGWVKSTAGLLQRTSFAWCSS